MTAEAVKPQSTGQRKGLPLGAISWSLFEGARNPYVILVTIYIFAPYIAATVVGDPSARASARLPVRTICGLDRDGNCSIPWRGGR